jgi:hypothetical protein
MRLRTAILAAAVTALAAQTATAATLTGRVTGGPLPRAAADVTVRAVDARTTQIRAVDEVGRNGAYSLRVPAGAYVLLSSVVTARADRRATAPIVRARRTGRVRVPVDLRRRRAPRVARPQQVTPTAPAVAIRRFTATGPFPALGPGLSQMLHTGLSQGGPECAVRLVEWERRADIQRELDLQKSPLLDPASRVQKRWIDPQVFVEGSVQTRADGGGTWSIRLRDASTGQVLGGDEGSVTAARDWFTVDAAIADRLLAQLCGGRYEVSLDVTTSLDSPYYSASGRLTSTVRAAAVATGANRLPVRFTGTAQAAYGSNAFASKVGLCSFGAPVATEDTVRVELGITPAGRLRVTWSPEGGFLVQAPLLCPPAPPGPPQPGAWLTQPTPTTVEMPVAGGSAPIGGGFSAEGGVWSHQGTLTVTRRPLRP